MMANSARDPYWHAAVRREVSDHPLAQGAIEDKCSTCHMPMARFTAGRNGAQGHVLDNIYRLNMPENVSATDGVSCTVCHQITPDNFGDASSFDGGFVIDSTTSPESRAIFASHSIDNGHQHLMQSASSFVPSESNHLQRSELCGTCHTLYTHALNEAGVEVGELPEQVPYLEWRHSEYRESASCQDCHMPKLDEDTPISSVLGSPRPNFFQHVFRGGNAFMLSILNKYRGDLGVMALPQEFAASIERTKDYLGNDTAALSILDARRVGGSLELDLRVESMAGHKLPTAYPSRRVWVHVTISNERGDVVFESGAMRENGSIVGNDNDADGSTFEPHYEVIRTADQVQIYEPILEDVNGRVTTGLLRGVRYVKDNRLLPRGFDKRTAEHDIGVFGAALDDEDFVAGSDVIRYRVPVPANADLQVEVELLYQSIGFRWAENLKAYRSAETDRFAGYYADSARDSAMRLASARVAID